MDKKIVPRNKMTSRSSLVTKLLELHGDKCPLCDRVLDDTTCVIDHIVPVAMGGTHEIDNMQLLFFRSAVTCITLFIYLLITDRSKLKINLKDIWYFLGTGILSFTLFGFSYFYTIQNASMSLAAMLLYTSPFFVMVMAGIFFREKR